MTKRELRARWESEAFWSSVQPRLSELLERRRCEGPLDLRGITLGEGPREELRQASLAGCEINQVDLSAGTFSVAFSESVLRGVSFAGAEFIGCALFKARFHGCSFDEAVVVAYLDDARFEDCGFTGTRLRSRGRRLIWEFGGSRVTFERCTFQGAVIQGVQLRASRFRGCRFERCEFVQCDLRGARFEECTFQGTRVVGGVIKGASFGTEGPALVDCEA